MDKLQAEIQQGYAPQGPALTFGCAMLDGKVVPEAQVKLALKSLNRHGLIAGATGTGKTKTIQLLAELLSLQGVPTLLMDLKGDLSGLAAAGESKPNIVDRQQKIGVEFIPQAFPVELLSLSELPGVKLRATITELGPALFAKMLGLNETQTGMLAVLFKYCQDEKIPLIDLADVKQVIQYVMGDAKESFKQQYGALSGVSLGSIQRKILELEQQGADQFFGEPSFAVSDFLQTDSEGRGKISILRLIDIQDRPKLFSTFMLNLLTQVYRTFPEIGDPDKPKFIIVIDEAHLVFKEASKQLLAKIESMVKLIRSKGVGIIFCTQLPTDVPDVVLSQLGLKIQHSLRAFTAKDRQAIKLAAQNYPDTEFYQTDKLLTELGIGEALITGLDEKGRPTPLAATLLQAPRSRMGTLTDQEIQELVTQSMLVQKYANRIDRESAYEIFQQRLKKQPELAQDIKQDLKQEESVFSALSKNTMVRQMARTMIREIMRAIMVALGIKKAGGRKR